MLPVVYGLLLTFRGDGYGLRLMRLPNLTKLKLHVHTCHITVPWSIPPSGVARESSGPGGAFPFGLLPVRCPPRGAELEPATGDSGVKPLCGVSEQVKRQVKRGTRVGAELLGRTSRFGRRLL